MGTGGGDLSALYPSLLSDNNSSLLCRSDVSGGDSSGNSRRSFGPGESSYESGGGGGGLVPSLDRDPLTNKYTCSRCGRSYLHQATLVRHQRYECGISASYPCSLCGRKFKRRDVLKGHMEKCVNKSSSGAPFTSSSHHS